MPHSRRRFLSLSAALTLGAVSPLACSQGRPPQNQSYTLLPAPQPKEHPGKLEVLEFFSYGCGHCNEFHPLIKHWVAKQPASVVFRRVPVTWNAAWTNLARLYYTLEQTGDLARLDDAVFAALHVQRQRIYDEKSLTAWYVKQGGEDKKFAAAFSSFSVSSKLKQAEQLGNAFQIDGVPTLIVEGRYRVLGSELAQQIANLDALLTQLGRK
jgi:thiol:disulfide interchange protein DsbA